jgi:hypothetical protein
MMVRAACCACALRASSACDNSFCTGHPFVEDGTAEDDNGAGAAAPELSLEYLEGFGGRVSLDAPLAVALAAGAADVFGSAAAGGARAAVSTRPQELLKRHLGSANLAKPVNQPAEVQLVEQLVAKHDALCRDADTAANDILRDYTVELLQRSNDPACQLRKKV